MRGLNDRLHEIPMLKGMQCVVVNEDADGALRRQVVRGVIEHLAEMLAAAGPDFGMGMGMRGHEEGSAATSRS